MNALRPFCDGMRRRDFLRVGSASLFGMSMSLPELLAAEAKVAENGGASNDVSVIWLFLWGGLSTIDTFDMKPDAPREIRGEFQPIATNVPGLQVCDQLPNCAKIADKYSLVRSFAHGNSSHGPADELLMTGYLQKKRPAFGSVVAHEFGAQGELPPYVMLPRMHPSAGPEFLGSNAAPFLIDADPSIPGFSVPDLAPPLDVDSNRLADRRGLLGKVDRYRKHIEKQSAAGAFGEFRDKAFGLMTSDAAKRAFDIQSEPEKMRQRYGMHTMGQSLLMARRLVASGVRYVMVAHNNWDTHENNFGDLKQNLLPHFDEAFPTLINDLDDRGMLEKTLVIVTGEFGRTPRINNNAGRDHWGPCFTILFAGGGVQGGRVIGASDSWAAKPATAPYGPHDFGKTIYQLLGIDSEKLVYTPDGRPVKLLDEGRVMQELL